MCDPSAGYMMRASGSRWSAVGVMNTRAPSTEIELTEAIMGHIGNHVSVRVTRPLNPPKVTMAAFEAIDQQAENR